MTDKDMKGRRIEKEEESLIDLIFKYFFIVVKYKFIVFMVAIVVTPAIFIILKIKEPEFVPLYKSTARIRIIAGAEIIPKAKTGGLDVGEMIQLKQKADEMAILMRSGVVLERVVKKVYGIGEGNKNSIDSIVMGLQGPELNKGSLTIKSEVNHLSIVAVDRSAKNAFGIVGTLIEETKNEIANSQRQIVDEVLSALEKELEESRRDLEETQLKLTKFIVGNEVLTKAAEVEYDLMQEMKEKSTIVDKDVDHLALLLVHKRTEISRKEAFLEKIKNLRESIGDIETFKLLAREEKTLVNLSLLDLLNKQTKELNDLLSINKEAHPNVVRAKEELEQSKNSISADINLAMDSIARETEELKRDVKNISDLIDQGLSSVVVEFMQLKRNVSVKRELAEKVLNSIQEMNLISKMITTGTFIVTDPPLLAQQPLNLYQKTKTSLNYILFSIVFGIGAGVSAASLADYLSMTVKDMIEIEEMVNFHILGEIPMYGKYTTKDIKKYQLPLREEPTSVVSEAFRGLRTNIKFRTMDKDVHTLLITSIVPKEGKTFVTANLATAFAQTDKKVLIIDCDLRKSTLHKYFNLENKEGITQLLEGRLNIKPISEILPNLSVLVAGKHAQNPAELLGSEAFDKALNSLKQGFDLVIIDSPPLFVVADAIILLKKDFIDSGILVTRANITPKKALRRLDKMQEDVKEKVIGMVFNGIETQRGKYGSYYYYQYDYYGKEKSKA